MSASAATNDDYFQGTAGTVTLSFSPTANSLNFNATGYTITTYSLLGGTRTLTGPINLANNVTLTLAPISSTTLAVSSITGGTASGLNIGGTNSATTGAIEIDLLGNDLIDASAPITITTTGTNGFAGLVSTGGTATNNASIINNSGVTTMLGAAATANTLLQNGAIGGSAGLQFSAGSSGGSGTVILNAANTYAGPTTFKAANAGIIQLGVDNALPTGTAVTMAASSSYGGILDLNGHNQTIASLASGLGGGYITNSAAAGTGTLTVNGPATNTFGLSILENSTSYLALVLANNVTLTLAPITSLTLAVSSITGGTGSGLNIGGTNSAATDATEINLLGNVFIDASAPITITTSGTNGFAGLVSTAGTATINASITNNSGVTTMLGAAATTNTLLQNGVISGSAGLQFSAGSSGGSGTVILNAANNYTGSTTFKTANAGTVQLGVDNALPTGTAVTMSGGILDLNGHNQTLSSLTSTFLAGGYITNSAVSGTATLTINGSATNTFALNIKENNTSHIALIVAGTGTTKLTAWLPGPNFSGNVFITNTATLAVGNLASFPTTTLLSIAAGATFDASAESLGVVISGTNPVQRWRAAALRERRILFWTRTPPRPPLSV